MTADASHEVIRIDPAAGFVPVRFSHADCGVKSYRRSQGLLTFFRMIGGREWV
jgi:hypothetical protein